MQLTFIVFLTELGLSVFSFWLHTEIEMSLEEKMVKTFNYKTALLSLFIKSMGDGFSKVICKYYVIVKKMSPNNFKQKKSAMNSGDYRAYWEISYSLINCLNVFTLSWYKNYNKNFGGNYDKKIIDDTSFCPKYVTEKYYHNFNEFFDIFKWGADINDDFFYESFERALSYLIARKFYSDQSCDEYFSSVDNSDAESAINEIDRQYNKGWLTKEEYEHKKWMAPQVFRSEYASSINDVRFCKKENKTFFKWVIDEFFKSINDISKAEEIIKYVFGENEGLIPTTFDKLKYEPGKHNWETFEKLFKNEHNDKKLMKLLKDDAHLAAYQIFQSRMFVAYFLENLCAELPRFVGKKNADELNKIISGSPSRKKPEDFLVENHKEKTESYRNAVYEILNSNCSYSELIQKLETLDKNCPATDTVKAYSILMNWQFYSQVERGMLQSDSYSKYFEICRKKPWCLERFAKMGGWFTYGGVTITANLGFLWTADDSLYL